MLSRRRLIGHSALGIAGLAAAGCAPRPPRGTVGASAVPVALVDQLHRRTFQFFWDTTDPETGLAPDRWPTPSFSSIAAIGFALTAYGIGASRGWVTRAEARARTLTTLAFLAGQPQGPAETGTSGHKGFFYHFLGVTRGHRFAKCELSTVDTALLLAGALFAQGFFDGDDADEKRIRDLAEAMYAAVDWNWIRPAAPFIAMGWHPETGFIPHNWDIYNEALLLHILALGSPTHAVEPEYWRAVTARFDAAWGMHWGQEHLHFPPLFGHQYSHAWIDFRGVREPFIASKNIDYFENSRRATLAQKAYAEANPGKWAGYGGDIWGLTACDGPGDFRHRIDGVDREFFSYSARGPDDRDDGTLAPTAAAGSIAFAPEVVVPAIEAMHAQYGRGIWGEYGFWDSFNPTLTSTADPLKHGKIVPGIGWVDGDYLGIDQGAIVLGIENWKSGLVWQVMRKSPHIIRGMKRAGFTGGWLDAA